jgi:hypothetical protein
MRTSKRRDERSKDYKGKEKKNMSRKPVSDQVLSTDRNHTFIGLNLQSSHLEVSLKAYMSSEIAQSHNTLQYSILRRMARGSLVARGAFCCDPLVI